MTHAHTLTRHRDIQAWVVAHKGSPAIARAHTGFGTMRAKLALKFASASRSAGMPTVAGDFSPVSWSAWLAELDRQQLALRVSDTPDAEYELVERKTLN